MNKIRITSRLHFIEKYLWLYFRRTPYSQQLNTISSIPKFYSIFCVFSCFTFSGGPISSGSYRILWGLGNYDAVAVTGLGSPSDWDELECINGKKENVRIAAAGNLLF